MHRQTEGGLGAADATTLRRRAMDLLARREHARHELRRKLLQRGADGEALEPILDALEADGLLSDARFIEAYLHQQVARGKGPIALEHGLRERGVAASRASDAVGALGEDWVERAVEGRVKRFGAEVPTGDAERVKQARFLQGRGFTGEQVLKALERPGSG
ncbi:MAG: regulatory protein RecX [Pseudomonadota bacterium]